MSAETNAFLTDAQFQLARALGVSIGVAVFLWLRPGLAWVLVLGWCAVGVWLSVRSYRAAVKIMTHTVRRRAEIVVTEVAPQPTERERCVAILQHFLQPVPGVENSAPEMIDAFAVRCGNTAIEAAIRAVRGEDLC